jgi:hypothetical protein
MYVGHDFIDNIKHDFNSAFHENCMEPHSPLPMLQFLHPPKPLTLPALKNRHANPNRIQTQSEKPLTELLLQNVTKQGYRRGF